MTRTTSADVVLIGAGLAGATAASVLGHQGMRVILIDRRATYPACFKAEKIEPDQAELFRKFGLMEALIPWTGRIHEIHRGHNGRLLGMRPIEQYGIFYQDMVNTVRASLPSTVSFIANGVERIVTGSDGGHVTLAGGCEYSARLVALASGTGGDLYTRLGLRRETIAREHSLALGFTIARGDARPFPFDAVTYYPESCATRAAFLTLFRIGTAMRANLFVFWSAGEERTRRFVREPRGELQLIFPDVSRVIGEFDLVSRVEVGRIDLYRTEGYLQPGLVLIGDAFQSVCPTTGFGLTKVLTDVDVLCRECVPEWLSTAGMGVEKLGAFYGNQRKQEVDQRSLADALYIRRLAVDESLPWRARRVRRHWQMQFSEWRDYFRLTRKLTA